MLILEQAFAIILFITSTTAPSTSGLRNVSSSLANKLGAQYPFANSGRKRPITPEEEQIKAELGLSQGSSPGTGSGSTSNTGSSLDTGSSFGTGSSVDSGSNLNLGTGGSASESLAGTGSSSSSGSSAEHAAGKTTTGSDKLSNGGSSTDKLSNGGSSTDKLSSAGSLTDSTPNYNGLPQPKTSQKKMNATFVTLARNSDLWDLTESIRAVEDRFNFQYGYDWVFLNDGPFSDEFKKVTTALVSGNTRYGLIGEEHWSFPEWIDQQKAADVRKDMAERKIIYGDSISYRHMCRFESGFFFRQPLMMEYEWYWRVEPSIKLFCDIPYDPFRFMAENNKTYSFVLSLHEYSETVTSIWDSVKRYVKQHPEHIAANNSLAWLSDDDGDTYNLCHFWSNFEVGNLNWLRSKAYLDFFERLDQDGGFFYERWGDAPVHSIAAALTLPKDQIHFFDDIGYWHVPFTHCPAEEKTRIERKCHCNPAENFDYNSYACE